MRPLLRLLMVLFALTWWVLPAMGVIDLTVTWDPEWPVVLEAGWGVLFTGLGLSFFLAGIAARTAGAGLMHAYVTTAVLAIAAVLSHEPETWWIFGMLLIQVPLLRLLASDDRRSAGPPHYPLALLAAIATPVGLTYAWQMAERNRQALMHGDYTNDVDHFSVQAALGLLLVALPAAAALRPASRRQLGTITALMAGYLGLVSYHWLGELGGFSRTWSVAVMTWSTVVLVAAWWPSEAQRGPVVPTG